MTDIHIPPDALEAGARAAYDQWRHECADEADEPVENWREWDDLDEFEQDSFRAQARAAFEAMIGAWPLMCHVPATPSGKWTQNASLAEHLILPLMENPDAEA